MQTLNKHLARGFLLSFSVTLVVVTFVMCIGIVFKITELLARGLSWQPVLRIVLYGMPQALTYSIPVSILTASLLVFGRLSADGEITAMKATGISMWRIVATPLLIALWCTVFCVYLNNEIVPSGHYARRLATSRMGMETPLELLDEGRFIQEFPGLTMYIGRKRGNLLGDIRIYDLRTPGIRREVRATSGIVKQSGDPQDMAIDLFDVRIDPFADDRPGALYAEKWSVSIPRPSSGRIYRPKKDDKSFFALMWDLRHLDTEYPELDDEDRARQRTSLLVEVNRRYVLALACLAFAMLGIPLGVKAHRKESSVGVGISLALVFNFYLFIIIAESLEKHPGFHPHLIVWIPIVLAMGLGAWLIERNN